MSDKNGSGLFKLNEKQKKAFDALSKAFRDCENSGLMFYNNYGVVGVCDKTKIHLYDDKKGPKSILDEGQNISNEIVGYHLDSWADDTHYFHCK